MHQVALTNTFSDSFGLVEFIYMRYKIILLIIVFLIFNHLFLECVFCQNNDTAFFTAITIIITHYSDYKPISYLDENSNPQGYLIAFWKLWAKKNNINISFILADRKESVELIKSGYTHIHAGLAQSPELESFLNFAQPILEIKTGIFGNKKKNASQLDSYNNLTIGIVEGDLSENYVFQYFKNNKILLFKNISELITASINNKIDLFIYDYLDLEQFFAIEQRLSEFRLIETLYIRKLRPAVNKNNIELFNLLKNTLNKIDNVEIGKIEDYWFSHHRKSQLKNQIIKYSLITFILTFIIIFSITFIILKNKFKEKTIIFNKTIISLTQDSQRLIDELALNNKSLIFEIQNRQRAETELIEENSKVQELKTALEQSNDNLKSIIKSSQEEKENFEKKIIENIKQTISPVLKKLELSNDKETVVYSKLLQENINNIFSSFGFNLKQSGDELTSREMEISNYIKNGISSKEIAEILNISIRSVDKHRENIRKKLQLTNKNIDIKKFFNTIEK